MLVRKIIAGIVGGIFLTSLAATSVFADVIVEISGNGARSRNSIRIKHKTECKVSQKNSSSVMTKVGSSAHTGGNKANGNTGGDVDVDTGNASSTVLVTVEGSFNEATDPCCCECEGCDSNGGEVIISGNGRHSRNSITIREKKKKSLKQRNWSEVINAIRSKAKTGRNRANHNTDGSVEVKTGKADSFVDILVTSSSNTLNP